MEPLAALREATGDNARPATDADAIGGVPARFVAAPASTVEIAAVVRTAAEHDLSIVVRGAGTKQDWAAPPDAVDLVVETSRMTGIVEHAAGDLIAVVRAGTPLAHAVRTPNGASFSKPTNRVSAAITARFITPPTNSSAMSAQQHPRQ